VDWPHPASRERTSTALIADNTPRLMKFLPLSKSR